MKKVTKTDAEWRAQLAPMEYSVDARRSDRTRVLRALTGIITSTASTAVWLAARRSSPRIRS